MNKLTSRLFSIALVLSISAATAGAKDIVDTAVGAGQFKTLVTAIKAAGLVDTLKGDGPFTVFAPTDSAFNKLPEGLIAELINPENKDKLTAILTYHVVAGKVTAKDVFNLSSADTVNGQRLAISREGGKLTVAGVQVVKTDIECDNGVIHVIDAVMLPSDKTIPEVAVEAGTFKTLVAAVGSADLAEVLSGDGPFTVFAPSDEAFAGLPEGVVETLLKPENKEKLITVLKYHVVAGRVYADQAIDAGAAETLQGQPVEIGFGADGIKVNDATVVATDVAASNGVIHVIDTVLLPKTIDTQTARALLKDAVAQGSIFFNRGDVRACSDMYAKVCQEIVDTGDGLPESVKPILSTALMRAESMHSSRERSWALRHGIDLAYFALEQ